MSDSNDKKDKTDGDSPEDRRHTTRRQSLDGDGSWRIKTGNRRNEERRSSGQPESHLLDIEFPDELSEGENERAKRAHEARVNTLKSMLRASGERQRIASRRRQPVFAAGVKVRVTRGIHESLVGTILDADYIQSRALLSLSGQQEPQWIEFNHLGSLADDS